MDVNPSRLIASLIVFTSLLSGTSDVSAQLQEPEREVLALAPDTWALQFAVTPDFTLGSFSGTAVSIQRQYSERRALRLGVSLALSREDQERVRTQPDGVIDFSSTGLNTEIGLTFLWYQETVRPIRYFGGVGPRALVHLGRSSSEQVAGTGSISTATISETRWGGGIEGIAGVTWMIHPQLTVHAEYGINAIFTRRSTSNEMSGDEGLLQSEEVSQNRFHFGASGVRFGFSVYF